MLFSNKHVVILSPCWFYGSVGDDGNMHWWMGAELRLGLNNYWQPGWLMLGGWLSLAHRLSFFNFSDFIRNKGVVFFERSQRSLVHVGKQFEKNTVHSAVWSRDLKRRSKLRRKECVGCWWSWSWRFIVPFTLFKPAIRCVFFSHMLHMHKLVLTSYALDHLLGAWIWRSNHISFRIKYAGERL